jgi:hypothetical protein
MSSKFLKILVFYLIGHSMTEHGGCIRPGFTEIHGLTVKDARDAPDFVVWKNGILPFAGELPLAADNADSLYVPAFK